jgi:hypothetical protein
MTTMHHHQANEGAGQRKEREHGRRREREKGGKGRGRDEKRKPSSAPDVLQESRTILEQLYFLFAVLLGALSEQLNKGLFDVVAHVSRTADIDVGWRWEQKAEKGQRQLLHLDGNPAPSVWMTLTLSLQNVLCDIVLVLQEVILDVLFPTAWLELFSTEAGNHLELVTQLFLILGPLVGIHKVFFFSSRGVEEIDGTPIGQSGRAVLFFALSGRGDSLLNEPSEWGDSCSRSDHDDGDLGRSRQPEIASAHMNRGSDQVFTLVCASRSLQAVFRRVEASVRSFAVELCLDEAQVIGGQTMDMLIAVLWQVSQDDGGDVDGLGIQLGARGDGVITRP